MAGRDVAPGVRGSTGPGDPELHAVDEEFGRLIGRYGAAIRHSRITGRRVMYADAVGVQGEIEFTPGASPHPFLTGTYPVYTRFSNSASSDDVAPDTRGMSLMLLDPQAPHDPSRSPFNLTMSTGRLLFVPHAAAYTRYMVGGDEAREELAREFPGMRDAVWDGVREPVSYAAYHYYSKAPRLHVTGEGPELIRYRVVISEHAMDVGFHDPHGRRFPPAPPDSLERDPADDRPPSLLWNDLRSRVAEGGFTLLLQAQRHPLGDDADANRSALDASLPWLPHRYAYRTLATLRFHGLLDGVTAEQLLFDPAVAPEGLGIALARTPYEPASINHLRALVYGPAHEARSGLTDGRPRHTPVTVREPAAEGAQERRTVCVVGAGPSGLTAARELERLGHRVVVLESADEVAGKSASVRIDGRVYDLGAHICTTRYTELLSLACELGVETEPTTPAFVYDIPNCHVEPMPLPPPEVISRYHHLRAEFFPEVARPGLAHSAAALARPTSELLNELGVTGLATALGVGYTSCGYGSLDEMPALYFLKFAEHTGLIPVNRSLHRRSGTFTIKGGFARLWRRVAEELSDVRTGVRIESIERRPDGVTVNIAGSGPVEADDLLLTVALDRVLHLLRPTDLERDVAARIRTIDFRTVVCRVSGVPRHGFYMFPGPARGLSAYHSRYPDQDVCTCYCYGAEGMDDDAPAVLTAESMERLNGRVDEVLQVCRWDYMPHFGPADLASGIMDRIERSQGAEHTYHAGSLVAAELIETNIAYARDLVRRFFTPQERPAAQPFTGGPGRQKPVTGHDPARTPGEVRGDGIRWEMGAGHDRNVTVDCVIRDLRAEQDIVAEADGPAASEPLDGQVCSPAARVSPVDQAAAVASHPSADEISAWLVSHVAGHLNCPAREVDPDRPIDEHGLDSLVLAELHTELTGWLGRPIPLATLYRLPTLAALAHYLEGVAR
ncbi:hypothetical protein GCM10009677_15680 [Sphaerisporangium rubeum]|uniref:Acyl carrier protein n=1 Tax=Sphaerisporangium rubeum TaxID=321317 RepID=A0A7X0MA64_9ACTN|nr:FAD-dependent oxidoreductase [Sphaerisporangium rubeum]MBB6475656.1 acyl carrier protein [Sphaerisporangium rubeum]